MFAVVLGFGRGVEDGKKNICLCGQRAKGTCIHSRRLAGLFARDAEVIRAAADYLRAYAIDTLLTSILFCFIGYFNGRGNTAFVMTQGIVGAFLVRIPVSLLMSRVEPVSLFRVGLATPCSTVVQIVLFLGFYGLTAQREYEADGAARTLP